MDKTYETNLEKIKNAMWELAPRLPYHNYEHMIDVAETCRIYADREDLSVHDSYILQTAGLLHDIVYEVGKSDNEERSVDVTRSILNGLGYKQKDIDDVSRLIMITKRKERPHDILEKVIYDADIDTVGRGDFFEKSEQLRLENGIDINRWYEEMQPRFLSSVKFYTRTGKMLREEKAKQNLELIIGKGYEKLIKASST